MNMSGVDTVEDLSRLLCIFVSQNLHTGSWHTTPSHLSKKGTCHPMFASPTHGFTLEVSSAGIGTPWWPKVQYLKIPLSTDIVQSMIWKKLKNKHKDPAIKEVSFQL